MAAWASLKYHGESLGVPAMSNTADVFLCFWLMGHYAAVHLHDLQLNGWLLVLLVSLAVWRGALWLHTHPEVAIRALLWQAA